MANIGDIIARFVLNTDGFKKGKNEIEKGSNDLQKSIIKLGAAFGIAFGTKELIQFGIESVKLAERFRPVERAFLNTGASLEELRRSTAGTVSDFNLLQNTVKAVNFGIPVERLGAAFEFATIRAAETGESVQFLVDSIVTGIGRKSSLVLDNLGISAVAIQEEFKKTGDFAQAAFNLIEREGGKSTVSLEEAATSGAKLSAQFQNLSLAIGQLLNSDNRITRFLSNLAFLLENTVEGINDFALSVDDKLKLAAKQGTESGKEFAESILTQSKNTRSFLANLEVLSQTVEDYTKQKDNLNLSTQEGILKEEQLRNEIQAINSVLQNAADLGFEKYIDSLKTATTATQDFIVKTELARGLLGISPELLNQDIVNLTSGITAQSIGEQLFPVEAVELRFKEIQDAAAQAAKEIKQEFLNELGGTGGEAFTEGIIPTEAIKEQVLDLGNFIASSFADLGAALGDALSGEFDGSAFIKSLASFGEAFGKQLIAIGVASDALQKSIKNPYAAIAAGIGLIAISRLIKNTASAASSAVSNIGAGTVSTASFRNVGGFDNATQVQPIEIYLNGVRVNEAFRRGQNIVSRVG